MLPQSGSDPRASSAVTHPSAKGVIAVLDEKLVLRWLEDLSGRLQVLYFLKGNHISIQDFRILGESLEVLRLSWIRSLADPIPQVFDVPGGNLQGIGGGSRKNKQGGCKGNCETHPLIMNKDRGRTRYRCCRGSSGDCIDRNKTVGKLYTLLFARFLSI